MIGAKLAALVCKHMRAVCRLRRRLLKNNVEYSTRSRDPPPSENDDLTPGTDGGDDASLSPTGPKAMKRNELHQLCKLNFKSLTHRELQDLCKQKKIRANDTSVNMATALEALRRSAVAAADDVSAADDDGEDVEDDED